jgi:hypothetical protein
VVMNTTPEYLQELRKVIVRENLGPFFPAAVLIRMVYEATEHPAWARMAFAGFDTTPDPVLRSVVTYSYATGVFSSQDIEAAASHDPAMRYLCANHQPDWGTIRDFRRRNTPGIKLALARVFALALDEVQSAEHRYEADQRLARAIQADSCALDI